MSSLEGVYKHDEVVGARIIQKCQHHAKFEIDDVCLVAKVKK